MCKDTFAKNMPSSKVYEEFSKLVFKKDDSEVDVIRELVSALAPLCKSIVTDKNYSTNLLLNVTSGHIRIGTVNTWHGTPDIGLEAESSYVDVVVPRVSAVPDMYVEDKVDINRKEDKVRSQVVATTVVASFTNSNVYKKR